jgi:uncharacterized protein
VRDWIEGEIVHSGRHRSTLLNIFKVLFRFGGSPVGQAKLARETNQANNTVAQRYIEILSDLGCVISAYPFDLDKKNIIVCKPCKYHYMNLLVAVAYHPARIRRPDDFLSLPGSEQGMWYEWLIAQELQRRRALRGEAFLEPLAFWKNKDHEIDFYDEIEQFIEVKSGSSMPLEFAWFAGQFPESQHLTILNQKAFATTRMTGLPLEDYLRKE